MIYHKCTKALPEKIHKIIWIRDRSRCWSLNNINPVKFIMKLPFGVMCIYLMNSKVKCISTFSLQCLLFSKKIFTYQTYTYITQQLCVNRKNNEFPVQISHRLTEIHKIINNNMCTLYMYVLNKTNYNAAYEMKWWKENTKYGVTFYSAFYHTVGRTKETMKEVINTPLSQWAINNVVAQ